MSTAEALSLLLNTMNQETYMKHKRQFEALAHAIDFEGMIASGFMRELAKELTSEKH